MYQKPSNLQHLWLGRWPTIDPPWPCLSHWRQPHRWASGESPWRVSIPWPGVHFNTIGGEIRKTNIQKKHIHSDSFRISSFTKQKNIWIFGLCVCVLFCHNCYRNPNRLWRFHVLKSLLPRLQDRLHLTGGQFPGCIGIKVVKRLPAWNPCDGDRFPIRGRIDWSSIWHILCIIKKNTVHVVLWFYEPPTVGASTSVPLAWRETHDGNV